MKKELIYYLFIQDISRAEDTLATLKAMQGQTPTPQLELDIKRIEKEIELYSQEKLCYEAQILRVYHVSFLLSSQLIQIHSVSLLTCGAFEPLLLVKNVYIFLVEFGTLGKY